MGAGCLFVGALHPEFGCILLEKGCKQDAKLQKNVKKVCSKPYVFHRFSVCLRVFLSKICVTCVIYTFWGDFCWVKLIILPNLLSTPVKQVERHWSENRHIKPIPRAEWRNTRNVSHCVGLNSSVRSPQGKLAKRIEKRRIRSSAET